MIGIPALRRSSIAVALSAALAVAVALPAAPARAQSAPASDEELFKAKCTLCHTGHRIYRITPEQIRPIVERMRKLNPDWITQVESDHIATVMGKILGEPNALAMRTAWQESVARGSDLFNEPKLGTTGKSCASCHPAETLRNVEDAYPKFDAGLKRFVTLDEAINRMIQEKMQGQPISTNDQRYIDLLSYIKTLK